MRDKTKAMEELYLANREKIYNFLLKYTQSEEIAQDLMQDTFLNFFKNYSEAELSAEKSLMLLYTIARNNSINHAKKFSTKKESSLDMEMYGSGATSFEKKEELKDMETQLYKCLDLLPEDQRTAILLKNVDDLTLSQISEIMKISISTASRLVVKATANLIELAAQRGIIP